MQMYCQEAIDILKDMKVNIKIPNAAELQRKRNLALDMAILALRMQDGNLKISDIPNGVHIQNVGTLTM